MDGFRRSSYGGLWLIALLGFGGLLGCSELLSSLSPKKPAETAAIPTCQTANTAIVTFKNQTKTNSSYKVYWNGAIIVTLSPGETSQEFTQAASVQHTLAFKFENTNTLACSPATPVLAVCTNQWFSCDS